jgi:hypothetical protein
MRRTLSLLALALVAAGCSGETPVARVTLGAGGGGRLAPAAEGGSAAPTVRLGYPEVVRLSLVWELIEALPEGDPPLVFLHLVDGAGAVVRTFDHPFPRPWRAGSSVEDTVELYQSALAPALPAGDYRLVIGLYRPDGTRFPLAAGVAAGRNEYELARVVAAGPPAELPRIELVGDWSPIEVGSDRQVLASRWLAGEGRLTVAGPTGAGAPGAGGLWMRLRVPAPEGAASNLVLAEGATVPELRLTSLCGGAESAVTGYGLHEVEIPVEAAVEVPAELGAGDGAEGAAGAGCEVVLAPNFHLVTLRPGAEPPELRRAVLLETLAWRPPSGGKAARR